MSVLRPDFPNGTFEAVSVAAGITDVKAPGTTEAVRARCIRLIYHS